MRVQVYLHGRRIQPQLRTQILDDNVRVGALAIQLVDEGEPRDTVPPAVRQKRLITIHPYEASS